MLLANDRSSRTDLETQEGGRVGNFSDRSSAEWIRIGGTVGRDGVDEREDSRVVAGCQ